MRVTERVPYGDYTEEMKQARKEPYFASKRGRQVSNLIMVVLVAFFLLRGLTGAGGDVTYEMDDAVLGVTCLNEEALFIRYEDVVSLELVTDLKMDEVLETKAWDSGWCGTFANAAYGKYTLYAYSTPGQYIVVCYQDGTLIFNAKTAEETEKTYEELVSRCGY